MTTAKPKTKRRSPASATPAGAPTSGGRRARLSSVAHRVAGVMRAARASALTLARHVPGTVRATRIGAQDTTTALQTLPDSTLRWLAASSMGLSAGLRLARAPRIVVAAGAVPALIAGAAIALRPIEPTPPTADASDPAASPADATPA